MNIAILGTSNSIIKGGWVDGLKSSLPSANIKNLSIVASPGIQFGLRLGENFTKYDYVFFDSIPNDELLYYESSGYSESSESERIIFEILSTIASESRLIVLGFCLKNNLEKQTSLFKSRLAITDYLEAQFIDIPRILKVFRDIGNFQDLYEEHPAHPLLELSFKIGFLIGENIKNSKIFNISRTALNYRSNFYSWSQANAPLSIPRKKFSNSLTSQEFVEINSDDQIHFDSQKKLIGFYLNFNETYCNAHFIRDNLNFDLNLYFNRCPVDFVTIFVPIPIYEKVTYLFIDMQESKFSINPCYSVKKDIFSPVLQLSDVLFWSGAAKGCGSSSNHSENSPFTILNSIVSAISLSLD